MSSFDSYKPFILDAILYGLVPDEWIKPHVGRFEFDGLTLVVEFAPKSRAATILSFVIHKEGS